MKVFFSRYSSNRKITHCMIIWPQWAMKLSELRSVCKLHYWQIDFICSHFFLLFPWRQIESQVIEISRLQQVFTEKIFEQVGCSPSTCKWMSICISWWKFWFFKEHSIDYVQRLAVKTTDNIKLGNEEIQEAMKKNSALRLWILFVVIVLSFTLLFLDWYNDWSKNQLGIFFSINKIAH